MPFWSFKVLGLGLLLAILLAAFRILEFLQTTFPFHFWLVIAGGITAYLSNTPDLAEWRDDVGTKTKILCNRIVLFLRILFILALIKITYESGDAMVGAIYKGQDRLALALGTIFITYAFWVFLTVINEKYKDAIRLMSFCSRVV